jgi:predicted transcriptional regulator
MANTKSSTSHGKNNFQVPDVLEITDPSLILVILHEKKKILLNLLFTRAMTIQDLKNATKINPGTIKRHLDDLTKHNLVYVEETKRNDYNIIMKYYRATARSFLINIRLP